MHSGGPIRARGRSDDTEEEVRLAGGKLAIHRHQHKPPLARGSSEIVHRQRTLMTGVLRDFLALQVCCGAEFAALMLTPAQENADCTIKEMIVYIDNVLGQSPGKSTLADWLEGGLLVYPSIAGPSAPLEIGSGKSNIRSWLDGCGDRVLYVGAHSTMHWMKRVRGPTGRTYQTIYMLPTATTLAAGNHKGERILVRTLPGASSAADFLAFIEDAVQLLASSIGAAASEIRVVGDRKHLSAEHAEAIQQLGHVVLGVHESASGAMGLIVDSLRSTIAEAPIRSAHIHSSQDLCGIVGAALGEKQ